MTRFLLALAALALPFLAAPASAKPRAIAHVKLLDGKPAGTVSFAAVNRGVLVEFDLSGLPPGPHGIHLHVSGNCDPKTGFTSAGPILGLGPVVRKHGFLAEGGPLAGDLPNQFAGADGHLHAATLTNGFGLGNGKNSIFDRDGVAIIIDQRGDDYRSQPMGESGARVACGVIIRTQGPLPRPVQTSAAAPAAGGH
ncbi:MAG: superoxide dismutase family protein [Alphaproteobacteria bacterium]|nr:superoxide dismutase family protein [Alphaproteobacteria bacterium]